MPTYRRGSLIAFSGIDGAGKSTQIDSLQQTLAQQGLQPIVIWSRGGYTPGFLAVKSFFRRMTGRRAVPPSGETVQRKKFFESPGKRNLWLALAILDLAVYYGVWVRWHMARGKTVICDRYLWDTWVDFKLNFPQSGVDRWWLWQVFSRISPTPRASIVLLVPVPESIRRSDLKGEPFRETEDLLHKRLHLYQGLQGLPAWHVLDGCNPRAEIAQEIQTLVFHALTPKPTSDARHS